MITPAPNPHDWIVTLTNFRFFSLAEALGVLARHINTPARKRIRRLPEYFSGALCSIYGSTPFASTTHHILTKLDVIDSSYIVPEKPIRNTAISCISSIRLVSFNAFKNVAIIYEILLYPFFGNPHFDSKMYKVLARKLVKILL